VPQGPLTAALRQHCRQAGRLSSRQHEDRGSLPSSHETMFMSFSNKRPVGQHPLTKKGRK